MGGEFEDLQTNWNGSYSTNNDAILIDVYELVYTILYEQVGG